MGKLRIGRSRTVAALILACALAGGVAVAAGLVTPAPPLGGSGRITAAIPPRPAPKPVPTPSASSPPAAYTVKRVLPIDGPLRYGEWHWNEEGAPAGPIVITVDLAARVLSVFRDGHEIGATAIIYGADEKPTPLGVFPVTQKDADHVSNIYGAPMPYMLRMTNDGISIHGAEVTPELMTHGCVGVPTPFARKLFGQVRLGDKVIVTRGETLSVGQAITAA